MEAYMKRVIAVLLATSLIITGMWYYSQKVAENSIIEVELYKCEESHFCGNILVRMDIIMYEVSLKRDGEFHEGRYHIEFRGA